MKSVISANNMVEEFSVEMSEWRKDKLLDAHLVPRLIPVAASLLTLLDKWRGILK